MKQQLTDRLNRMGDDYLAKKSADAAGIWHGNQGDKWLMLSDATGVTIVDRHHFWKLFKLTFLPARWVR